MLPSAKEIYTVHMMISYNVKASTHVEQVDCLLAFIAEFALKVVVVSCTRDLQEFEKKFIVQHNI